MKKILFLTLKIFPLALILFSFGHVFAASSTTTELGTFTTIGDYVSKILTWAQPIIGSLAVLMLIVAGYLYMTSQGNPESIKKAKEIIIGVVTGLALLFLATLLFNTIGVKVITSPSPIPTP